MAVRGQARGSSEGTASEASWEPLRAAVATAPTRLNLGAPASSQASPPWKSLIPWVGLQVFAKEREPRTGSSAVATYQDFEFVVVASGGRAGAVANREPRDPSETRCTLE